MGVPRADNDEETTLLMRKTASASSATLAGPGPLIFDNRSSEERRDVERRGSETASGTASGF